MPISEIEYYEMQENAAIGQIITACAKAIFEAHEANTMAELQRTIYKYTPCGPAVSFELHDGAVKYKDDSLEAHTGGCEPLFQSKFVYVGDERAATITQPWLSIRAIGVSSIVEGSDAEVPIEWIELEQYADDSKYEGDLADLAKIAVSDFNSLVDRVNDEATELWHEANDPMNDKNMLEMG